MHLPKVRDILLAATLSFAGCQALKTALPIIESIMIDVLDAENKTGLVEKLAGDFLKAHPDPVLEAKVDAKIKECKAALQVAIDAANGSDAAANGDKGAAFAAFNKAWLELEALVEPMAIIRKPGTVAASTDHLMVDEPFSVQKAAKK